VFDEPWQTDAEPDMAPGCAGTVVTDMLKVRAVPAPHELLAVTEIVPPAAPATAVIDIEVELPVHPDGKAQV